MTRYLTNSIVTAYMPVPLTERNKKYVYGLDRVSQTNGDSTLVYHNDRLGSAEKLTDLSGNVMASVSYDEWGKPSITIPGLNPNYTGHEYDQVLGIYYSRARFYDPATSRWLASDPYWNAHNRIYGSNYDNIEPDILAIRQSSNLYEYVLNNPIRFIDPEGLWCRDVHHTATMGWAIDIGFSSRQARIIGNANYGIDSGSTGPMPWQDQSYHFNTASIGDSRRDLSAQHFNNAVAIVLPAQVRFDLEMESLMRSRLTGEAYVNAFNEIANRYNNAVNRALVELGMGLHPLQDIAAHGNLRAIPGHAFDMRFDDPNYDWVLGSNRTRIVSSTNQRRLQATEAATRNYFRQFICQIGGADNLWRRGIHFPGN